MNINDKIKDSEAFNELLKDLYKTECKKSVRYMIAMYVLIVLLFVSVLLCCYLVHELNSYEQITITTTKTTTETYTNDIEGDDANIVNGNQYNYKDNAIHNQNNDKEDD